MSDTPAYITVGDGFADVQLKRGLTVAGAAVKALRMREPSVEDQLAADATKGSEGEREVTYFANLCDLAPTDLRQLKMADYKRLQEAYRLFLD